MPDLLTPEEITAALAALPHWKLSGGQLTRTSDCASFPAAIAAVSQIAIVAENMDHHPDIDIRWRTVTFTLSTHSEGGITALDVRLATQINAILD